MKRQHVTLAALLSLLIASLACSGLGGTSNAEATALALAQSIEQTATAGAAESFDADDALLTAIRNTLSDASAELRLRDRNTGRGGKKGAC